ncbi:hypothetical protein Naga_100115g4 [Nannochloropsis gaditana]|uniref:Uncharacterized protein n=1 Tax=Nannochloropsis gaditana TaxID=72520 RepID=W7U2X8_9STRA|nr:hypothetical protein Naga_100115g4 [Nannochloropsis gaditana]
MLTICDFPTLLSSKQGLTRKNTFSSWYVRVSQIFAIISLPVTSSESSLRAPAHALSRCKNASKAFVHLSTMECPGPCFPGLLKTRSTGPVSFLAPHVKCSLVASLVHYASSPSRRRLY